MLTDQVEVYITIPLPKELDTHDQYYAQYKLFLVDSILIESGVCHGYLPHTLGPFIYHIDQEFWLEWTIQPENADPYTGRVFGSYHSNLSNDFFSFCRLRETDY